MPIHSLGKKRSVFQPAQVDLKARNLLGMGLILLGLVLAAYCLSVVFASGGHLPWTTGKGQQGWSWALLIIVAFIGAGMLGGGVLLVRRARLLSSFRIALHQDGLVVFQHGENQAYRWEEILAVQERHIHQGSLATRSAWMPVVVQKSVMVNMHDGESLVIDSTNIKNHLRLIQLLQEEAEQRNIYWDIAEEPG